MGKRLDGHKPSVRFINGLTIYFKTKDEILAWDDKSYIRVRRIILPYKGYYAKCWKPLLERLYHNNNLSRVRDVALLAARYDAWVVCPSESPPKLNTDLLIRPSKYHRGGTMGIFKATDTSDCDIVVYSKYCIECDEDEKRDLTKLNSWAQRTGLVVKVVRTAYRPADHKRAAEIYANEDYPAFVVWNDVKPLSEFVKMIDKGGKGGGKNDVQHVQSAKRAKRKGRVDVPVIEAEDEDEKKEGEEREK